MSERSDYDCARSIGKSVGIILVALMLGARNHREENSNPINHYDEGSCQVQTFDIGEHIVSILIDDPISDIMTYDYHEGYKPVGISSSSRGSCLLYVNDQVVEMNSNGQYETGGLFYGGFGYVLEKNNNDKKIITYDTTVEYAPGTHIISETIDNPCIYEMQYEGHVGYEPIGIASSTSGKYNTFRGACILYVNTETVICDKDTVEFGTPKEAAKTLVKEQINH